jgi:hypothetical protein
MQSWALDLVWMLERRKKNLLPPSHVACTLITILTKLFLHSENRALWYILIIKPTRCTISQIYFDKVLCMFRTDLLSIIRGLNTVHAAIDICHAGSVDCLLTSIRMTILSQQVLCQGDFLQLYIKSATNTHWYRQKNNTNKRTKNLRDMQHIQK